jgi:hypothetical protein
MGLFIHINIAFAACRARSTSSHHLVMHFASSLHFHMPNARAASALMRFAALKLSSHINHAIACTRCFHRPMHLDASALSRFLSSTMTHHDRNPLPITWFLHINAAFRAFRARTTSCHHFSSALASVPFCDRMRTYTQIVNGG